MFHKIIIYLRRKEIIKCLPLLFYLFCIIVCITSCSNRNSNNGDLTEIINIGEEIYAGNQYYDKDDYKNAISHYVKAYKAGKEDGIILYRIAYSAEQLQGLTNEVKEVYRYALEILTKQYPDHKYYTYAKNKVAKFNGNNILQYGIAENGDLFNRDNDGDGRLEPIYVKGYFRKDGTYVRSHYRARPR